MGFAAGNLVLYRTKSAAVSAVGADKIEIRIEGGKTQSVRPKDIELLHPGPVTALPPATLPDPDFAELLELMEGETFSFADFTELAYSSHRAEAAWSAYLLLTDGFYFTGSVAGGVTVRPEAERQKLLEARDAKAREAENRAALLERIKSGKLLDSDRPAMREIEQVALGESTGSRLLRDLGIEAEAVKAHALLVRCEVWDHFVDPWPSRFGIPLEDPDFPLPELPDEQREDLTGIAAYAIDDIDSHDPDDAISFVDGMLLVHVADPAAVVTPGSPIDLEAEGRGANLYLPEKITSMLPPGLTDIFGLGLAGTSPAITFAIKIDDEGRAELERVFLSRIKVTRLDYAGAEPKLAESPLREIAAMLERFRERRRADGALFIDLPEVKVKVKDRQVAITPLPLNQVRELVANSMLAAGSAFGKWAMRQDLLMPFSTQVDPELNEPGDSLPAMFAMRRGCSPSVLSVVPGKHAGLGLDPYIRVTSPLRRYGDLLAHQQLRRFLKGEDPLDFDYLSGRIAKSEAAALERRKLERQVNEFWKLVFLAMNPDYAAVAVPVLRQEERITYLIPELAFEYKNRFAGDIKLGDELPVRLVSADPVAMSCRMLVK